MAESLAQVLMNARRKKGWTLREAEAITGIHNAHLSQLETGKIERPGQPVLWKLADAYDLDFKRLLRLAGHTTSERTEAGRRSIAGAVLRGLDDLDDQEQEQLLAELERLRKAKNE
jgi:transcriptional regulator with XRE-family HTH domain